MRFFFFWLALTLAACGKDATGPPSASVAGNYVLAAFNSQTLPANDGPIPTRDGSPSRCDLLVTTGFLTLEPDGTFSLGYERHDSCDGALLDDQRIAGTYTGRGSRISFRVPSATPPDFTFEGESDGNRVVVDFNPPTLTFQR